MPNVDPALWRDIMTYLRRRHAPICRQWFEELVPAEFDAGLLKVVTTNSVQQTYLQRKCLDQFTEAAQATTGNLVAVRFITDDRPRGDVRSEPRVAEPELVGARAGGGATATAPVTEIHVVSPTPVPPPQPINHRPPLVHDDIVLSPDYAFENFVTGPSNQLAWAAATAVANQPGKTYNPLFIHGGVGLGKTHLLQAICQTILHKSPEKRICYLSCETFMNQFLDCVQSGKMSEFRHRYRHVDVLVIDDIHCLANRERTQEEFFHTFNELQQSSRQIVLSSDSPPNEIPQLEARLVSRFSWGMVAHVSKPDYETRLAIIRAKARLRGLEMPDDVMSYLATRIESNARELEGAITTVQGYAALQNKQIDLQLSQLALNDTTGHAPAGSQITLQQIITAVTAFYSVKLSDLQSKRRHKSITGPRQVCMWLARRKTRFSLEEIGGYFGGRDHTTVMHSIRTVDDRMTNDGSFAKQIEKIEEQVGKT